MALAERATLIAELRLDDKMSGALSKVGRNLGTFERRLGKIGNIAAKGMGRAAANIERLGVAVAGLAVTGLVATAKAAGAFGEQMNIINTIAQKTPEGLDAIGLGIRKLARDTGADMADLTGGYYDLLSAGIKVEDSQNALAIAYRLSRGALSTTGEAVDFLTTAINAYGLSQKETTIVADQFAQAVADGKVKMSEISSTFANVAAIAKTAGLGIEEIAAAYAHLTAQGVPAAEVTTQMNRAIVELMKPAKDLLELQEDTGKSYAALASKIGLVPALEQMRIDAEKAGIPFQKLFGRLEGYKFALQTTGPAFAKFMAEQRKIIDSTDALNKQFDEREKGLNYQFGRLKANVLDAAISIGQGFSPELGGIMDKMTEFVGSHGQDFVNFGKDIGRALAGIDWAQVAQGVSSLADGLKIAGAVAKTAFDIFNTMPEGLKALLIGGFAVNKLTGGALGGIVGELGKGLIKGVLGINAGVVNITAGTVTGGGGVAGAASKGGGIMGAVRVLGAVTIAGASITLLAEAFGNFMNTTKESQTGLQAIVDEARKQTAAQTIANLNATVAQQDSAMIWDKLIAETWAGGQITQNLVEAAGRLADAGLKGTEAQTAADAVANALRYARTNMTGAVGPLEKALARLTGSIDETSTTILTQLPKQLPALETGPLLPKVAQAIRDALRGSTGGLVSKPDAGSAAITERAIARGLHPTVTGIDATMKRNAERVAQAQRAASILAQFAAVRQLAAQVSATAQIVSAIHSILPPTVNVTSTVTVRNVATANAVNKSYNTGGRTPYSPVNRGVLQ